MSDRSPAPKKSFGVRCIALGVWLLIPLATLVGCSQAKPSALSDQELIYCSIPSREHELQTAGQVLGLALKDPKTGNFLIDGQIISSIEKWRNYDVDSFAQACNAILPPEYSTLRQNLPISTPALLGVIIGAIVSLVATEFAARRTESRSRRKDTTDLFEELGTQISIYLDGWRRSGQPDGTLLDQLFAKAQIRLISSGAPNDRYFRVAKQSLAILQQSVGPERRSADIAVRRLRAEQLQLDADYTLGQIHLASRPRLTRLAIAPRTPAPLESST